ncbi:GNAT family N-acetyltransferase [Pseudonocardia sp. D17]|uniref:GNAT family N-acetyltransferase n=1 Tax=Pseudonocardia sp. D17 TaxID=882661 RepID=UPI002B3E708C|nr:hypothetical protein PSD17_67690 [Pseudonocardia sp. D17]
MSSEERAQVTEDLTDNTAESRFELRRDGELVGWLYYRHLRPDRYALLHTEVEPSHRRQGVAGATVRRVLDEIRARGGTVTAICSFVVDFLSRTTGYADLLDPRHPGYSDRAAAEAARREQADGRGVAEHAVSFERPSQEATRKEPDMSATDERIVATARATLPATNRLETEIRAGDFVGVADDPAVGTPGAGPTPTEYLMMALASCTAITLRSYADRKYDYAGDITVDVTYHEPTTVGASRYLHRTIRLSEEVPAQDFQSMINIVEKTPVTLLLQFAWSVRTEIANGPADTTTVPTTAS